MKGCRYLGLPQIAVHSLCDISSMDSIVVRVLAMVIFLNHNWEPKKKIKILLSLNALATRELDLKYNLWFYSQLPKEFLQISVAYLDCCSYWDTFREKMHERICEPQGNILGLVHKSTLSCLSEGSHSGVK